MKFKRQFPGDYFPIALTALTILIGICFIPGFDQLGMYSSILTQAATTGIPALGMLFVLVCGDVDLSIGAQSAFYGMLCAYLTKMLPLHTSGAILATLVVSVLLGLFNGWLIDKRRLNPMIATIATGVTLSGVTFTLGQGMPIFNVPALLERIAAFRILGLSFSAILFGLMGIVTAVILYYTYWGKFLYAIGWNEPAAHRAGVPVRRARMLAYALCSLFCAIAAIVFIGRIGLATPSAGSSDVLDVLTIAALGGVGFSGGRGKVLPVVCAALLLSALTSAFLALRVAYYYQNIIKGAILFAAISTKFNKS